MKILQRIFIFSLLFYLINCTCSSLGIHTNFDFSFGDEFVDESNDDGSLIFIDKTANPTSCNKRSFSEQERNYTNLYKCCFFQMKCSMKDEDADIDNNVDIRDCTIVTKTKHKI